MWSSWTTSKVGCATWSCWHTLDVDTLNRQQGKGDGSLLSPEDTPNSFDVKFVTRIAYLLSMYAFVTTSTLHFTFWGNLPVMFNDSVCQLIGDWADLMAGV